MRCPPLELEFSRIISSLTVTLREFAFLPYRSHLSSFENSEIVHPFRWFAALEDIPSTRGIRIF